MTNETFSWMNETALMARLAKAQRHSANRNIDIMTFAGLCDSRAELERHVERYEEYVLEADIGALVAAQFGKKANRRRSAAH